MSNGFDSKIKDGTIGKKLDIKLKAGKQEAFRKRGFDQDGLQVLSMPSS